MTYDPKEVSLKRAETLRHRIDDYLEAKQSIPLGLEIQDVLDARKKRILEVLGGTEEDWDDYKWQLKNRVNDEETLRKILSLTDSEVKSIKEINTKFRWAISPYYLSLIDPKALFDPIKLMAMPTYLEILDTEGTLDPMDESHTNPAGAITRRYPDRLIVNVTNECGMYCRYCQRRRNIGTEDSDTSTKALQESFEYIRNNPEIRDVLITGGDPLTLPHNRLEWIVKSIREIEHVEIIRIGSRTLVTLPQRITDELTEMLKQYHPIYINTHVNHPVEITEASKEACEKLANAGIPLGNQAVLLNGVNNDKFVMRRLNQGLLQIRVKPYYLFHAKSVKGTHHFNTSIDDGIEIMEYLRGYTSGMAIPTYIVNAPGGNGKTPILPEYLVSRGKDHFTIRTWEGKVLDHENHPTMDIRKAIEKHHGKD
ncbi:MAG: glutamate 2,3-aminomutase [Candidatus Izemoplasmataceae bacterium]